MQNLDYVCFLYTTGIIFASVDILQKAFKTEVFMILTVFSTCKLMKVYIYVNRGLFYVR